MGAALRGCVSNPLAKPLPEDNGLPFIAAQMNLLATLDLVAGIICFLVDHRFPLPLLLGLAGQ
jgi:hypothetical protein